MTRHPRAPFPAPELAVQHRRLPTGEACPLPLARCSRPWNATVAKTAPQPLDGSAVTATRLADGDAHAADDSRAAAEI